MYLGMALCLLGWALCLGSVIAPAFVFGYVAYITRFQILPEERFLVSKFGQAYVAYMRVVKRWV
ncbi:hypothetical protein GCM10025776_27520 [Corallincola platygyrae]